MRPSVVLEPVVAPEPLIRASSVTVFKNPKGTTAAGADGACVETPGRRADRGNGRAKHPGVLRTPRPQRQGGGRHLTYEAASVVRDASERMGRTFWGRRRRSRNETETEAKAEIKKVGTGTMAPPPSSSAVGAFAAVLYGAIAVAMGFINKAVMSVYGLEESNFLLLSQMVITVLILFALRQVGKVSFAPISVVQAKKLLPVAILYNANVGFALASLAKVSVPTYNTLKRLTPAVVLSVNSVLRLRDAPSKEVVISITVVVVGCLVAGYGDLEFDPAGYVMGLTSCALQASYLLVVERTGAEKGMDSVSIMVYNSLLSAPPLLLMVLVTGELGRGVERLTNMSGDAGFMCMFTFALLAGMLLNYALFLCTLSNSALTTTVVGVLKGVVSTVLGFFLLGGLTPSWLHLIGIVTNTAGGVAYTMVTYKEKQERRRMKVKMSDADLVGKS